MARPPEGRPVVDYDHHSKEYAAGAPALHAELRARCPVAWTEHHDGFWVVTAHGPAATAARDLARFSSDHDVEGDGTGFLGITIPSPPGHRFIPSEVDPPEFMDYRRMLQPWFSPGAVERWSKIVRGWAADRIDAHLRSGRIDLVADLANPIPAMFTLAFLGLPVEEWERWAEPLHASVYAAPATPEKTAALAGVADLRDAMRAAVEDRLQNPRDDLATAIANGRIGDERITVDHAVEVMHLVVAGGVDTTTALIANSLFWLHEHPEARQQLIDEPELRASAREEFLRVFTPTQATARTAVFDTELDGVAIARGERVLLSWAAANRDPAVFEDPETVRLDRDPNRHLTFGAGQHRCLGSHFARVNFDVVLDEVLARIPDYVVDTAHAQRYKTIGIINGWVSMPATFTPSGDGPS